MHTDSSEARTTLSIDQHPTKTRTSSDNNNLYDQVQHVEIDIAQGGAERLVPLSFAQQQMWLLAQMISQVPVYNETVMVHLPGPLHVSVLEQSLNEIIRRHAILRTSFPVVDGQPVQMIHPSWKLTLSTADLRHLSRNESEARVQELATKLARAPFDLTKTPLLRAVLLHLGAEAYCLCLVMHHIIFDARTLHQVFLPELRMLYEAFLHGQPSPLPPLPREYANFAQWQQEQIQGDALLEQRAYWQKQLAGVHTALELPSDRPLPPTPSYRGAKFPFVLSQELTKHLKRVSQHADVSLDMLLMTALLVLLHRYTGQNDMLLGNISWRNEQAQGTMGLFLNTLIVRAYLTGNPTFDALLAQVRKVVLEAQAHQDVPFETLVNALGVERSGHQAIIQVMFSLDPPSPILPCGWTITRPMIETHVATCDLFFALHDQAEGLTGWLEYNSDLFDASSIKRILQHWEVLLGAMVLDQTQQLSALPILTEQERHQLIVEWNNTQFSYPEEQCIHQLFEAQAERLPDATALVFAEQKMTYGELNAQANQLAHHLQRKGVGPEVRVGIAMERSFTMIVATLAVLKAGGAYVPLNPTYPEERLSFLLQDAQPLLLLTHKQYLTDLPAYTGQIINLDSEWTTIAQESTQQVIGQAQAASLAYIIYTSGSTGKPKGVLVTHQNLVSSTFARITHYEPIKSLLLLSPFIFDASVGGIFWTLCQGGALILPETGAELEVASLIDLIVQYRVSHFVWATVLYDLLLEKVTAQQQYSLRTVIVGGESCSRSLVQRHYELLPQIPLFNEYGPTEGTVWSTVYRCQPQSTSAIVPIGRPIANAQVYLLDAYLQPVPLGVAGEMYIGGNGIARGYLNRPELTNERFIANPFGQAAKDRLYKTGDIARYLSTGDIEFLGRTDHQVKIRGFRVEPGEVEELILKQIADVREVVVIAREVAPGDKRLVGYLVPATNAAITPNSVRTILMAHLPDYMIPTSFVFLDKLPLSATGKVDNAALLALEPAKREEEETFVAPTQMAHYQLLRIWEELLDARPIGIRDNFFLLGGHSLLATRLVNRIEQVFGKRIALTSLFAGPTIEQLADVLQQDAASGSPLIAIQTGGSKRPFFFLHGDWTGGPFYCFTLAQAMGSDQPFYALGTCDFNGEGSLPTVESMAATQIELLRSIQPEGPYLLGGYCNGGMMAYEIARQLQAQGQQVERLILINPSNAEAFKGIHDVTDRIGTLLCMTTVTKAEFFLRMRHILRHIYRHVRPAGSRVEDFPKLLSIDARLDKMFPPIEALYKDYVGLLTWIVPHYKPGYYPGKITFLWARDELFLKDLWHKESQAKEIEEFILPGTHMTVITEHIHMLAKSLNTYLKDSAETT